MTFVAQCIMLSLHEIADVWLVLNVYVLLLLNDFTVFGSAASMFFESLIQQYMCLCQKLWEGRLGRGRENLCKGGITVF